jgi:integrase
MAVYRPKYRDPNTGEVKQSAVYWYDFVRDGQRYRESTDVENKRQAEAIETAAKNNIARGQVGIAKRKPAPTLAAYSKTFERDIETLKGDRPATVIFYKEKLRRLLEFEPLANCRLDRIDEALIASYSETRKRQVSRYGRTMAPASVNRELATLRRLLRRAKDLKVIIDVPKIELLGGERRRDFVLTHEAEKPYLDACPQPLRDAALLMLDTALRSGEASALEWRDITLKVSQGKRYGYLQVRRGKSATSIRTVSLTDRVSEMLMARKKAADTFYVFPARGGGAVPGTWLDRQHDGVRRALKLPADFVLHSLRHSMLTRLGEAGADAFTIKEIAGHSSIVISQRYVHPSPEHRERAFERLEEHNRAAGKKTPTKVITKVKKMAAVKSS